MKSIFLTAILACFVLICSAQQIKPYLVVVKTPTGKQKGILYKSDSVGLVIDGKGGFTRIDAKEIRSIKVRAVKKNYKLKKFVKYDAWNESHFERNPNGVPVRKWGEKDPTVKEELNDRISTSLINVIGNIVTAPIHAINPSIARMKFHKNDEFAGQVPTIRYYSIQYQTNPDRFNELEQLRSIGKAFKAGK